MEGQRVTNPVAIIVGHGTREAQGIAEFNAFANAVVRHVERSWHGPQITFDRAFLELASPSIQEAVARCKEVKASHVVLVPLMLLSAQHMKVDIPAILADARNTLPYARLSLLQAINVDSDFVQVGFMRLIGAGFSPDQPKTAVVLVGRGSRDEAAIANFGRIASALGQQVRQTIVEPGFLTGIGPSLESALSTCVAAGAQHIFAVPYLWFYGYLVKNLPKRIAQWQTTCPDLRVNIASHLGLDQRLVQNVSSRLQIKLQGLLLASNI